MIKIYKTIDGKIHQVDKASEGCWIAMINPTATEILRFQTSIVLKWMICGRPWMKKSVPVLKWKIVIH